MNPQTCHSECTHEESSLERQGQILRNCTHDDSNLHRKNAAEWAMWLVLYPIARLIRLFRR
jgi:hypothetical protein